MTLDQCHDALLAIRRRQGTRCPLIQVACAGAVHRGRLIRTDSDPESRHDPRSPFGTLALGPMGMVHGAETILQIAGIAADGLGDYQAHADPGRRPLSAAG